MHSIYPCTTALDTSCPFCSAEEQAYAISLQKLQQLLADRTKYYENADIRVDLAGQGKDEQSGAPTPVVMYRLLKAVREKIQSTREERESRKQFTIERSGSSNGDVTPQ